MAKLVVLGWYDIEWMSNVTEWVVVLIQDPKSTFWVGTVGFLQNE